MSGFGRDWLVMQVPSAPPPVAELLGVLVDLHTLCPLSHKTKRPCQLLGLAGTEQRCFLGVGVAFCILHRNRGTTWKLTNKMSFGIQRNYRVFEQNELKNKRRSFS